MYLCRNNSANLQISLQIFYVWANWRKDDKRQKCMYVYILSMHVCILFISATLNKVFLW